MKKLSLFGFLLISILTLSLAACDNRPVLSLYNWGEYLHKDVIRGFQKETGIRVKQTTFDSNEVALTMVQGNTQFDLIIPSEYAIEKLTTLELLEEINWEKVVSLNPETDLAPGLKAVIDKIKFESDYDLLKHAIPYFWGNVVLLYNKDKVAETDLTGWDLLKKGDKYKVAFYDSARDSFMAALTNLGYSMNTKVGSELEAAKKWLEEGVRGKRPGFITDDIFDDMPSGRYDVTMAYSGDAVEILTRVLEDNLKINLDFLIPEEGTNIWVDAMVIPKGANQEVAYRFINYVLTKEAQLINTKLGYLSPRADVNKIQASDAPTEKLKKLFEIEFRPKDSIYRYDSKTLEYISDSWSKIRTIN